MCDTMMSDLDRAIAPGMDRMLDEAQGYVEGTEAN
jgi:hypothetical protein